MISNNLLTMVGKNSNADLAIAKLIKEKASLEEELRIMSCYFQVRITFEQPLTFFGKTKKTHTFNKFFINGQLCYAKRKNSRYGKPFYPKSTFPSIIKIRYIRKDYEFKSYEEFAKKFDRRYTTEQGIKDLWNSKSAMHGGRYNKKDFKTLNKRGKEVLRLFDSQFTGIHDVNVFYNLSPLWKDEEVYNLSRTYNSNGHRLARDIRISSNTKGQFTFYTSYYPGCLNGDEGVIVNKHTYLYMEKD